MSEFNVNNIHIVDSTLREGQQAVHPLQPDEGVVFSQQQQLEIAELLERFGVDYVEIGTPFSPFAMDTAQSVADIVNISSSTQLVVHVRCIPGDIDAALAVNPHVVELYIGSSSENRKGNGGRTLEKTIAMAKRAIGYVREQNLNTLIRFSPEDAFRTDPYDLRAIVAAVSPMIDILGLPDTTGSAIPEQVREMVGGVITQTGKPVQIHGHNDFGLALANYLAAFEAGATVFDTTVLGLGERNGIPSLSGFTALLCRAYDVNTIAEKYNLKLLPKIDQTVADFLGIPVPHNQPISAPGAFSHVAGVHANAQLNHDSAYQVLNPEQFGLESRIVHASSVVGGAAVLKRAIELGFNPNKNDAKKLAATIRETACRNGGISVQRADTIIYQFCNK